MWPAAFRELTRLLIVLAVALPAGDAGEWAVKAFGAGSTAWLHPFVVAAAAALGGLVAQRLVPRAPRRTPQ